MSRHSRSEERPRSRPDMHGANRYWGARDLPTVKTEFFDAVTMPAPAGAGSVATIRLYGPIDSWGGYWGVSSKDIGEVLDALPDSVDQIILRINSPGGEVFEAMTVLNMFRAHPARVLAVVDGLAASAASFLAAGCDEVVMSPGTQMMIHSPWGIEVGNAREMRKHADRLDGLEVSMTELYIAKAGEQDWATLLAADTWLTADAAVELGLADRIAVIPDAGETATVGEDDVLALVMPASDDDPEDAVARLSRFAARSREPLNPPAEPGSTNRKESDAMSYESLQAGLRDRLGMTDANATDEQLLAAVDARNTAATASTTVPEGTQLVDASALAALQSDAAAGREALANQVAARRDNIVDSALREGKITTAARGMWRAQLDVSEEGASAILDSLAPNTAVPVAEIGVSDSVDMDADAYPANWKR